MQTSITAKRFKDTGYMKHKGHAATCNQKKKKSL
jgi:hypothetical protein